MLSVRDLTGNEEPFVDFKELKRARRINGQKDIELTVLPSKSNSHSFDLIEEETTIVFDDDYIIKKINKASIGNRYIKKASAIHKFFVDLINKQQPKIHNGSITFRRYMEEFVFEGTGIDVIINGSFPARSFENLGNDNRLALLSKGIERFKVEFELVGNQIRFKEQIGNDTDFQFRFGHNIKSIELDVDTTNLATVISGTGAEGISATYTSDNADIFGEIDSPPINDERFTSEESLLEEMISRLQDTPEFSLKIDFTELRAAGYPYTIPNEGDRVFVIYEPMDDLLIETRILEIEEEFDVNLEVIKTTVTLSNYKDSFVGTMFDNIKKELSKIVNDDGIVKYDVLDEAVRLATEALQSAETELTFENGIIAREKSDPNKLVVFNSAGLGISSDGGQTFSTAMTADGIVADVITVGTLRGIDIIGTNIISFNPDNENVVTLTDGEITTFVDGKQRFGVYGNGLVAYHWETERPVATFRASHINNMHYGADIMGSGDYLSIGRQIGDSESSHYQLHFDWSGPYDTAYLYGGSSLRDSGRLNLKATYSGGSADGLLPGIILNNFTESGTSRSNVVVFIGRDNRSPSSSNFSSGFQVWQYKGDGKGGESLLFDLDTNTNGKKYIDAHVDKLWVAGDIDINGGITTRGTSHLYGDLNVHGWDITGIGKIGTNASSRRVIELYNASVTTNNSTYEGVRLSRLNGLGGVHFHTNKAFLTGGTSSNFALLGVGSDGTGAFVQSMSVFGRTYSSTSQMVRITENGILGRSTSSRRYKINEKTVSLDYAKQIHNIDAVSWYDKRASEDFARTLSTGEETEHQRVVRIGGIIAEDTHDAGLGMYVNYDDKNRPDGVASFMWTLLIPISKDHEKRLNEYDTRFGTIESKIDNLQSQINELKGVA